MTHNEIVAEFERMLRNAPDLMTPMKVSRCSPIGKNRVYALIKIGELKSIVYQGGYLIAKVDLIEYLADHCNDKSRKKYATLRSTEE